MFKGHFIGGSHRSIVAGVVALVAGVGVPLSANAADSDWPTRPVTVVVPAAAGGGADVLTRIIASHMGKATGKTFIIENRPGAGGGIGMSQIKRAAPDGYTIGYGNLNTLAVNPSLFNSLPYDAKKDFAMVGALFAVPNMMVVRADSPFTSVADVVAAAKKSPGKLFWAAGNLGSSGNMAGELFKHMADIDASYVPYSGDTASLTDLIGGQLDYALPNAPVAWPLVQAGKLRALAVTAPTRVALFPDVPTMDESGLKGYDNNSWGAMIAPAGTPQPVLDRMSAVLEQVMKSDAVRADLAKAFATPISLNRVEMAKFVESEQGKWAEVIKTANIPKQ